jgi:hypothetical protein
MEHLLLPADESPSTPPLAESNWKRTKIKRENVCHWYPTHFRPREKENLVFVLLAESSIDGGVRAFAQLLQS